MKNIPLKLFAVLLLFAIPGCNKDENNCNTSYTFSGILLDGKTGLPIVDSGTTLSLYAADDYEDNQPGISVTSYPSQKGKFSLSYNSCGFTGHQILYISLNTPNKNYNLFDPYFDTISNRVPLQQNVNQTWTAATNGVLVLYLKPLSPLLPGDTLFINFQNVDTSITYTFLSTKTGILDSAYFPAGRFFVISRLGKNGKSIGYEWENIGDPYISRDTIKY